MSPEAMASLAAYVVLTRRIAEGLSLLPQELGRVGGEYVKKRGHLNELQKIADAHFEKVEAALRAEGLLP